MKKRGPVRARETRESRWEARGKMWPHRSAQTSLGFPRKLRGCAMCSGKGRGYYGAACSTVAVGAVLTRHIDPFT